MTYNSAQSALHNNRQVSLLLYFNDFEISLKVINWKTWAPNVYSRLCASHFTKDSNPVAPSKVMADLSNGNQEQNYFLEVKAVDEADEVQVNVSEATEVAGVVDKADEVQVNVLEATASNSSDHYCAVNKSPKSFKRQADNKLL